MRRLMVLIPQLKRQEGEDDGEEEIKVPGDFTVDEKGKQNFPHR